MDSLSLYYSLHNSYAHYKIPKGKTLNLKPSQWLSPNPDNTLEVTPIHRRLVNNLLRKVNLLSRFTVFRAIANTNGGELKALDVSARICPLSVIPFHRGRKEVFVDFQAVVAEVVLLASG